jgi:hypothetical protein
MGSRDNSLITDTVVEEMSEWYDRALDCVFPGTAGSAAADATRIGQRGELIDVRPAFMGCCQVGHCGLGSASDGHHGLVDTAASSSLYRGHRYLVEIISHCV